MKLKSMTNFVFQQIKQKQSTSEFKESVKKYAELLIRPLEVGMFVPCDEKGFLLKEPEWWYRYQNGATPFMNSDEIRPCQEYKKALESVLFKGRFDVRIEGNPFVRLNNIEFHLHGLTVERLIAFELELTESTIKQLGL